jgi:hypothetical protein
MYIWGISVTESYQKFQYTCPCYLQHDQFLPANIKKNYFEFIFSIFVATTNKTDTIYRKIRQSIIIGFIYLWLLQIKYHMFTHNPIIWMYTISTTIRFYSSCSISSQSLQHHIYDSTSINTWKALYFNGFCHRSSLMITSMLRLGSKLVTATTPLNFSAAKSYASAASVSVVASRINLHH